jgi:L-threonylcarbamoyladenylate synthase
MPSNAIALRLIEALGRPIAATSANLSEHPDPTNAGDVMKYLDGKIHLILDGGPTPGNVPSTVLDVSVSPPVVLRQGKLAIDDLEEYADLRRSAQIKQE